VGLNKESNITIIVVTHEKEIADFCRRLIFFRDGVVLSDEARVGHDKYTFNNKHILQGAQGE